MSETPSWNNLQIANYDHATVAFNKARDRLEKIASGELFPLYTSLETERKHIGGFYPGDQIVFAGRTGSGKSAKLLHDLYDFVDWDINPRWKDKIVILYDSLEMPNWRNALRIISRQTKTSVKRLLEEYATNLDEERRQTLDTIQNKFKNKPLYFSNYYPNVNSWETQKINAYKSLNAKEKGITIVNVVDHTRLILKNNENSEEQKITGLMNAGMRLKNNYDMINIFLSQMNRNIETGSNRKDVGKDLPIGSDLFGADSIEQTADVVMAYHRPGSYGLIDFILPNGKVIPTGRDANDPNKNDNLFIEVGIKMREGKKGNILLKHDLENNRFEKWGRAK